MSAPQRMLMIFGVVWSGLLGFSVLAAEPPEFRPWERLFDAESRRFHPNRHVSMRTIGDLGYKSWNRSDHAPRETRFTTDRHGFRNAVEIERPEIIVIGDSYVAGAGLSDDETVTSRLSEKLGAPVYNFAAESLNAPARFFEETRFSRQRPKLVIWAPVARGIQARPLIIEPSKGEASARNPSLVDEWSEGFRKRVESLNRDNGLVRESRFGFQKFFAQQTTGSYRRTLPNGEKVLALSLAEQGLLVSPEERKVDHCIEMVVAFSQLLEGHGVEFVFSPVPDMGSIYPEIFPEAEQRSRPPVSFLDRLVEGVRARGVEVVDLRPVFLENASPYLYLADDTHWNGRATQLAADAWFSQVAFFRGSDDMAAASSLR